MSIFNRKNCGSKDMSYRMQCDRTGAVGLSTEMRKTYDGLWVLKKYYYERNPQDFIVVPSVNISVPVARPIKTRARRENEGIYG